ncbi:hypothetical protein [Kriegella aquimaris]|uniref:Uncharacterized protein n=1 Tax=Kriegella aquimaris TaxID=192904 RepID=A0A1G9NED7_9FLAO|nr:hypothetical protein [Kriegella aquimaris]SDL84898.1 hypothetical protein SAMN04488514_103147 [Kriegella aquimaris]
MKYVKHIDHVKIMVTLFVAIGMLSFGCTTSNTSTTLHIVADQNNDLFEVLSKTPYTYTRYEDVDKALKSVSENGKLIVLALNYPQQKTVLPPDFYERAKAKNLKVYVEFPNLLNAGDTGDIIATKKERLVVTSDAFGAHLPQMSILDAGIFSYVSIPGRAAILQGAKVAGFKSAVYGLNETDHFPILFKQGDVLVATTKLSNIIQGRYSPIKEWNIVIGHILSFLIDDFDTDTVEWTPSVKPAYSKKQELPENAYRLAVDRGSQWYDKGRFLIHPEWKNHWQAIDTLALPVGPPMDLDRPSGDGSLGVMEGHYSYINPDGSQPYRYWLRADCVAETAMTMAMANSVQKREGHLQKAENLMDFLFNTDTFMTDDSKNPDGTSYGLIGWADTAPHKYYGDDNARVILGGLLAAQLLGNKKWDQSLERLILANFRTAGETGFRGNALNGNKIAPLGWRKLSEGQLINPAPHYESWLWATYIWLYDKTGYKPLLEKAKRAITITMDAYPNEWIWTNGLQQERARMILPLAWLVRVENTEQHRQWLTKLCDDLLEYQVSSGALREVLGDQKQGKYGASKSNEAYGTSEAPVIFSNGDPIADMLYTTNFALFSLNEAAQVTQEVKYLKAVDKLSDFLVRIQSTSSGRSDLDGAWFRAFDYENWEYYGSNADHGWGAWGTLTGWTQSFITTTLALKLEQTSYWDKTKNSSVGTDFEHLKATMLPGL